LSLSFTLPPFSELTLGSDPTGADKSSESMILEMDQIKGLDEDDDDDEVMEEDEDEDTAIDSLVLDNVR
jgi:hypothetical protein